MKKLDSVKLQTLVLTYLENKDNEILTQILLALNPKICKKARWLSHKAKEDFDDMKQEVTLAVIKRLDSYNVSKGQFLTYLINTFNGDPTDILATKVCRKRGGDGKKYYASTISLNTPINLQNENKEITLLDCLPDKKDPYAKIYEEDLKHLLKEYSREEALKIIKREVL